MIRKIILIIFIVSLNPHIILAELPGDIFYVPYSEMNIEMLKEIKGIVTFRLKNTNSIDIYLLKTSVQFTSATKTSQV